MLDFGIAGQFFAHNLKESEIPPLNLKMEEVAEFPVKVLERAKPLTCWSFLVSKADMPTVVGFSVTQAECLVHKAWFIRHKGGSGIKMILVTDYIGYNVFLLDPQFSGWRYWWDLSIMYQAHSHDMYDSRQLQLIADGEV